ncbi:MAG: hypothetical protein JXR53_13440, partial [Bacteroidales bacterium]|nr:hypothetical protein [Bacteroidales bacterium]
GRTSSTSLTGAIKLCDAFVSSDSGPYHMAVALGIPVIAIFNTQSSVHYHKEAKILIENFDTNLFLDNLSNNIVNFLVNKI